MTAAADALNITPQAICHYLNRNGHLDLVGLRNKGVKNARKRPVNILGRKWSSVAEMRKDLGLTKWQSFEWTKPTATPGQRDMLLAALMKYEREKYE